MTMNASATCCKKFLIRNGFLVTAARDAAHARRILSGLDFDLIVLDVMMPGEDGRQPDPALRETRDTPILLLTAKGETDDRIAGLEAGADDYLAKPFEPKELLLRINAILRRMPETPAADTVPEDAESGSDPLRHRARRDVAGRRSGPADRHRKPADEDLFRPARASR